jgi:hypothetical protein
LGFINSENNKNKILKKMTNNNNLYELPKTEIVQELKTEIPSFEEFTNSYEYDENIANSYHLENQDQEQQGYGPCVNDKNCDCDYILGREIYLKDKNGVK